jgi:hypothetical protein
MPRPVCPPPPNQFPPHVILMIMMSLSKGISGGGVYAWTKQALKNLDVRLPLAGIGTDFISEHNLLVATRLDLCVRLILANEPELAKCVQ